MSKRPWKGKKGGSQYRGGKKQRRGAAGDVDDTHFRRFSQIKADAASRPESIHFEERKEGDKAMRQIFNDDGTVTDTPRIGKRKVALRVAYCGFGYKGSQIQPAEKMFRTIEVGFCW